MRLIWKTIDTSFFKPKNIMLIHRQYPIYSPFKGTTTMRRYLIINRKYLVGCKKQIQFWSSRLNIKTPKKIKITWNARRNGKIMTLVWIAEGSDVAKSIKPIAVTAVKRPDNHLGNMVVLKNPIPQIETPKMVDE